MPKPTSSVAMFVISTGGFDERRDVGERLRGAALDRDPDREHGEAGDDQPERARAAPAPRRSRARCAISGSTRPDARAAARRARRRGPGVRIGRLGHPEARSRRRRAPRRSRRARRSSGRRGGRRSGRRAISPAPPPMPKIAEIRPMLPATRSRGNSSRMIPKQSGKMPPPKPCRTRPATTTLERVAERGEHRAGAEDERARARASGACRTCRRAARRSASRRRRRAGSR